jgi:hypothetical protein
MEAQLGRNVVLEMKIEAHNRIIDKLPKDLDMHYNMILRFGCNSHSCGWSYILHNLSQKGLFLINHGPVGSNTNKGRSINSICQKDPT